MFEVEFSKKLTLFPDEDEEGVLLAKKSVGLEADDAGTFDDDDKFEADDLKEASKWSSES